MTPMGGLESVRAIRELRPELPVILAGGGNGQEIAGMERAHLTKLAKPYSLEQLLVAVANGINP
jgi:DNA-binding NtrC family response regulator